ncbi:transposon, En/Spm-like protein [Tanacetum coccineum]
MKDPYMFMSMLIPGPKTPTNIDVYLQPLIDELKDLWGGINAYDAHRKENFALRTALLWTINDFPAYCMLSGWSVKGYNAFPICMNETSSSYLSHSRKNIKGKTKDTWKSHKDLMDKGLKKSLHLVEDGNSFIMPMAWYHFTKDKKQKVLNFLASIKFLDGFASNISRCVKEGELQLSHMKSHDFYVFIQKLLPLSIRGSLTKEARLVLYELSDFIQILYTRNMYIDVLEKQEEKIALIMCKLERIFPPSFFDIMTHLLIHFPFEAKKGGPFQYCWMFPFERKMRTLKGYVKNTARPKGCIAERSLDNECLNFCLMYLNDVETIFNKVERNNEMVDIDGDIFVFSCKGCPLGSKITSDISNIELEYQS